MIPFGHTASRRAFHSKTDAYETTLLRHDILVKDGMVYRYSRIAREDETMVVEEGVINAVLKAGVPAIPVLIRQDEIGTYQVMRRARGVSIADLSEEMRPAAWASLAGHLRNLHSIRGTGAGLVADSKSLVGAWDIWAGKDSYLQSDYLNTHVFYAEQYGLIDAETRMGIFATFARKPISATVPLALLHGDLSDYNVFVYPSSGEVTDIIDWEDALIGDPVFELASWACFLSHCEENWEAFFAAYYGATERPADFSHRFWFYFLRIAISRLVNLHRHGYTELAPAQNRVTRGLDELARV